MGDNSKNMIKHFETSHLSVPLMIYRGYQMSVGLILSVLNELNKSVLCEPLTSTILRHVKVLLH